MTLLVSDYDEAIKFYCQTMGFDLIEDTKLSDEKRWVRVRPAGGRSDHMCDLLLAKANNDKQRAAIGNQTGGRVAFFLKSDSFDEDFKRLKSVGVDFVEEPRSESYGKVAVFRDPFGNLWDLLEAL